MLISAAALPCPTKSNVFRFGACMCQTVYKFALLCVFGGLFEGQHHKAKLIIQQAYFQRLTVQNVHSHFVFSNMISVKRVIAISMTFGQTFIIFHCLFCLTGELCDYYICCFICCPFSTSSTFVFKLIITDVLTTE